MAPCTSTHWRTPPRITLAMGSWRRRLQCKPGTGGIALVSSTHTTTTPTTATPLPVRRLPLNGRRGVLQTHWWVRLPWHTALGCMSSWRSSRSPSLRPSHCLSPTMSCCHTAAGRGQTKVHRSPVAARSPHSLTLSPPACSGPSEPRGALRDGTTAQRRHPDRAHPAAALGVRQLAGAAYQPSGAATHWLCQCGWRRPRQHWRPSGLRRRCAVWIDAGAQCHWCTRAAGRRLAWVWQQGKAAVCVVVLGVALIASALFVAGAVVRDPPWAICGLGAIGASGAPVLPSRV